MELSKLERINLINQFLILEKLYPEEAEYYSRHRKALEEGYVLHYKWIFEHLHPEMSESECREVLDILEMYRAITWAYFDANDTKKLMIINISFLGLMVTKNVSSWLMLAILS